MHPRTAELLRHLDANRVALHAAVAGDPSSLRETRPAPDRWSVAEVLEHLARVEEQLTRFLGAKRSEARSAGALEPGGEVSPVVQSVDQRRLVDRSRRITAGDRVLPRGEMDSIAALTALEKSRLALRDLVTAYDGVNLGAFTHPHPVLGVIDGYR